MKKVRKQQEHPIEEYGELLDHAHLLAVAAEEMNLPTLKILKVEKDGFS